MVKYVRSIPRTQSTRANTPITFPASQHELAVFLLRGVPWFSCQWQQTFQGGFVTTYDRVNKKPQTVTYEKTATASTNIQLTVYNKK